MKNLIKKSIPFLAMFILSIMSVVVSCQSTMPEGGSSQNPVVSINAGKMADGNYTTNWVFESFNSVVISNRNDHSQKVELSSDEWKYDQKTTEIEILRKLPFEDPFIHVEGYAKVPHTFVLGCMAPELHLLVLIDGRLAIEGHDYTFKPSQKRIVFRNNADLRKDQWFIHYDMENGGTASLGNWEPENRDQLSYFLAEKQKRVLENWYETQDTFWFLEESKQPGAKPRLAKRKPLPGELEHMKSQTVPIIKYRGNVSNKELTEEAGFKTELPEKITVGDKVKEYILKNKTIEEYVEKGDPKRIFHFTYSQNVESEAPPFIHVEMSKDISMHHWQSKFQWVIKKNMVQIGDIPVKEILAWSKSGSSLKEKPEVIQTSSWYWKDKWGSLLGNRYFR